MYFLQVSKKAAYHRDPYLGDLGIRVDQHMVEVKGRVLDPPPLEYQKVEMYSMLRASIG